MAKEQVSGLYASLVSRVPYSRARVQSFAGSGAFCVSLQTPAIPQTLGVSIVSLLLIAVRPSVVCLSVVCLSVCNVRALYSGD